MNVAIFHDGRIMVQTPDPVSEVVELMLAQRDDTMVTRTLAEHYADDRGCCRACTPIGGVGRQRYPCVMRAAAERASARINARTAGPGAVPGPRPEPVHRI